MHGGGTPCPRRAEGRGDARTNFKDAMPDLPKDKVALAAEGIERDGFDIAQASVCLGSNASRSVTNPELVVDGGIGATFS
jgi:hypothetical protein